MAQASEAAIEPRWIVIELQSDSGVRQVPVPGDTPMSALSVLFRELGYEFTQTRSAKSEAVVALRPIDRRAHTLDSADGVISEMARLLQMIPEVKVYDCSASVSGIVAKILSYRTGRTFHVSIDAIQQPLSEVRS